MRRMRSYSTGGGADCNGCGHISRNADEVSVFIPRKEFMRKWSGLGAAPKTVRMYGEARQQRHGRFIRDSWGCAPFISV